MQKMDVCKVYRTLKKRIFSYIAPAYSLFLITSANEAFAYSTFVAGNFTSRVFVINATTNIVTNTATVGLAPIGLMATPDTITLQYSDHG